MLEKIVSGAQTGADRGGLDAAIAKGVHIGGWVPKGRKAEDGVIPEKYIGLAEMPTANYIARTEQNVIDSDATLCLTQTIEGAITGGTKRTAEFARQHGRPCVFVIVSPEVVNPTHLEMARRFILENRVKVLNVAGPRESKQPGVQEAARVFMEALIDALTETEKRHERNR